jgi:hypothetical protein
MALNAAPLLCPFTIASDIFTLKKDTAKMHCSNAGLNVPNNAPLMVYQVALVGHWLVMGLKTDNSPIDTRLSKMEATIENIASLTTASNLAVNQLIEREATTTATTKATFTEEPKWTTVMAKNVRQVVSRAVETLDDVPKQEECKFNLRLTSFEAKEGETKNELVQRLNTGPNEVAGQGRCCQAATACDLTSLHLDGKHTPRHSATQVCNERGSPGYIARAQGPNRDQVGPKQKPHTHTTRAQVRVVATIQGGQGNRQTRILAHN